MKISYSLLLVAMSCAAAAQTAPAASAPPFEPLSQLAGDWESPGVGAAPLVLRLRLNANGALTGTIDVPEPMALRMTLKHVEVSGRSLTYTMPDGQHTYQGAFSKDGRTVQATGMSTIDATYGTNADRPGAHLPVREIYRD
jgi:hypothetical protein